MMLTTENFKALACSVLVPSNGGKVLAASTELKNCRHICQHWLPLICRNKELRVSHCYQMMALMPFPVSVWTTAQLHSDCKTRPKYFLSLVRSVVTISSKHLVTAHITTLLTTCHKQVHLVLVAYKALLFCRYACSLLAMHFLHTMHHDT
jgi:hypothetical protein